MDNDETAKRSPGVHPRGTVIAGRFKLEELAGRGGMGSVYRAIDTSTGLPVALKLLDRATSPESFYRFNREASLLAGLRHPSIVSYVAHGIPEVGHPYLAMEWLEGSDLARHLARQTLSVPETLVMLRHVAEALTVAHRQGIVHRDLKPSNLFLRGGRPENVAVLDFGLARYAVPTLMGVTGSHTVVGTPGYMAPEQASSKPEIPPAADIFSLGCVLYECLTGRPPFEAPHFTAALAKILFAEPPALRKVRPGLPAGLQVLVDRMLAKDPQRRLPDADALLEALAALESVPELLHPRAELVQRPLSLMGAEQKLVSVLLVSPRALIQEEDTADWNQGLSLRDALRMELSPHGAQVELLADGSLVATLVPERGTATDQVALAARCALTFKERWPEAAVVLTTGLGVVNERLPVGEAMDRAGQLLRQLEQLPPSFGVVMDEVTAGLLGASFQLSRSDSSTFLLQGEQLSADESRPLLGRPTPCVGREQELAMLDFTFTSCVEEPAARALLVTAPAGVGKSRLRHEFLRRMERKEQPPLVLLGRGDPMSTGAAYGLLGQALRRLFGVMEGVNLEARRTRLYQRVALRLPEAGAQEVSEFLGELCALPFPEEGSPRLRAARNEPRLMSAQVGRALVAFLKAECAHQPVLLVLEDLHWSDALTVKLVDEVLRELAEHPFMVLALARPDVRDIHPELWARRLQEMSLLGLSRKAGARLVREVLGSQVSEAVVQKVVEQADGNALFLEELIRMVDEGRGDESPETVLAVLQSRLMRMETGLRQVLQVASFFGRTFWSGAVRELLAGQLGRADVDTFLRQLVEQEVLELQLHSRFPSMDEYRFRHALVRDAAYGLVPDLHRPVGHRLAGEWLEREGEPDALVLATHHQLGQQPERAARCYTRAAEQFFERHDFQETQRCVGAALACGVSGEALSRLRALQATVAFWKDQWATVLEVGAPVLDGLKAGSPLWCRLLAGLILGSAAEGLQEEIARLCALLLRVTPAPEATAAYTEAMALLGSAVIWSGDRQLIEVLIQRSIDIGADDLAHDAMAYGWAKSVRGQFFFYYEARPWQAFLMAEEAARGFREIGSERNVLLLRCLSGATLAALGGVSEGVAMLRECVAVAQHTEQILIVTYARQLLLEILASSPERAHRQEAHALGLEWLVLEWMKDDGAYSYKRGLAHVCLAQVLAADGELLTAESHARKACEQLMPFRTFLSLARRVFSSVLLALGRAAEARQVAELGVRELEEMGGSGVYAVAIRLALAEACLAEGDGGAGEAALLRAVECVQARARDIPDAGARERFLRQVPENARTLELARQYWGRAAV